MKFILYRFPTESAEQTFGEWTILGQKSIRSSIKQLNWCEIHHWKIYYILKWGKREIIDKLRKSEFRHSTLSNQIQTFAVFYTTNRFLSCWFFYVVFSRVYFLFCLSNQKFIFIFYEGFRALCYSWCVRNYEHFCSFFLALCEILVYRQRFAYQLLRVAFCLNQINWKSIILFVNE